MKLKCNGAGRDKDNDQFLWFAFNREPTDDELRYLHEVVKRAAECSPIEAPKSPHLRVVDQ